MVLALISTNNVELVEVSGYDTISSNDKAANIFYISHFITVPYMLQEEVEPDGKQLASGGMCFKCYI